MLRNYLKIGWRNLRRNYGYTFINVGGLAAGMCIALLVGLWVWDEITFDRNHDNYDRLTRLMQHQTVDGKVYTQVAMPRPLENVLRNEFAADFRYISMSSWTVDNILTRGEQSISGSGNYVQKDFPEMFSLRMISGTRKGLEDPSSILLSASTAKALFGDEDPINQSIRLGNRWDVKVTGVFENLPNNSEFNRVQFLASWEQYATENWIKRAADQWDNNSFQMFAMLPDGADAEIVSTKIRDTKARHSGDSTYKPKIFLAPMKNWHLRSRWENGVQSGGSIQLVWLFAVIGVIVLLLACINFVNLTTARSEKRAREVGIRMTMGSVRSQLIRQFMSETFLVVFAAFVLAMLGTYLSLPWFNRLASKEIVIAGSNPLFWLAILVFVALTALLAGAYPSFYLSGFRPVQVLKGTYKAGRRSYSRKALVILQFTTSIVLAIGALVVYQQLQYSKDRPIGYNRDGLIYVQIKTPDFSGKYESFRQALFNSGAVVEESVASSPLTSIWSNWGGFSWPGKDPALQSSDFGVIRVSHEYGATIGWKVIEGRDFSRDFASDSMAILVNEAAVKFMNVNDPVGMEITNGGFNHPLKVIGVVKDLIMESPYQPVRQNIYMLDARLRSPNWFNIRLNPTWSASESLEKVEGVFKSFAPGVPFDYKFADEEFGKKFRLEERIGTLAGVFAGLATLISCLGLIGLASFVAEQATREIGIRKVLGATLLQLWTMLSKGFLFLVVVSGVIALPLAYYLMSQWLNRYTFHVEISWWMMGGTFAGAMLLAIATVSYHAIRAGQANPVECLKEE